MQVDALSQVRSETHTKGEPPVMPDYFDPAVTSAVVALANVDRALRRLPPIFQVSQMHGDVAARLSAVVILAALSQHPAVVLEALNDAGEDLFDVVNQALTDPDAAVVNDDVRLREACGAWFKRATDVYRGSLAAQLAVLRSPELVTHRPAARLNRTTGVMPLAEAAQA